jgi:hypothetical protein
MSYASLGTVRPRSIEQNSIATGGESITSHFDFAHYGKVMEERFKRDQQADPMEGNARVQLAPSVAAIVEGGGTLEWR